MSTHATPAPPQPLTNNQHLASLAKAYAKALAGKENVFALTPQILSKDRAHTTCSTFLRLLLLQAFDVPPMLWEATFPGRRARDISLALERTLRTVTHVEHITPGTLFGIRYDEDRDGMSGHCGLVVEPPTLIGPHGELKAYRLEVVDSVRSSHGREDSRWWLGLASGGVGQGAMRLLCDKSGRVKGYTWSLLPDSEFLYDGHGQTLALGDVPGEWKQRADAAPA